MKINLINEEYLKDNYKDFFEFIKTKKNICIVGKGLLNKKIEDKYDLYIGTSNTLNILPKIDILQLNDFEGIFGNEKYIKELKYILFPINLHYKCLGKLNITYLNLIEYIYSYKFSGKLIIYKLIDKLFDINLNIFKGDNPNLNCKVYDLNFIKLNSHASSDIFSNLIIKMNINFKINIDYYGICTNVKCNPDIEKNLRNSETLKKYINMKKEYLLRKYNNESDKYYEKFIPRFKLGFKENKFIKSNFY